MAAGPGLLAAAAPLAIAESSANKAFSVAAVRRLSNTPLVFESHVAWTSLRGVRAANKHAASGLAAPVFSLQLNLR